jgi:hypothetical protein
MGALGHPGQFGERKILLPLQEIESRFLSCVAHRLLTVPICY